MKTRCDDDGRGKQYYDKCKEKDDMKVEFEELYELGWPRVWISKEEALKMFPDTNMDQHKHDTNSYQVTCTSLKTEK